MAVLVSDYGSEDCAPASTSRLKIQRRGQPALLERISPPRSQGLPIKHRPKDYSTLQVYLQKCDKDELRRHALDSSAGDV